MFVNIKYVTSTGKLQRSVVRMNTKDGAEWFVETAALESLNDRITSFQYIYQLKGPEGQVLRTEWNLIPRLVPYTAEFNYVMSDAWRDIPAESFLYTNAYMASEGMARNDVFRPQGLALYDKTLMFCVSAPQVRKGQTVALCGNSPVLGSWNATRYLKMQYAGQSMWVLTVNGAGIDFPIEYKYVLVDEKTRKIVKWEDGANRTYDCSAPIGMTVFAIDGGLLRTEKPNWKVAGVAADMALLRSRHSWGMGDFGDLRLLVDWAGLTGLKAIQLSSVNATVETLGLPESACDGIISVHAMSICHLDVEAAGGQASAEATEQFRRNRMMLNARRSVGCRQTAEAKEAYLRQLYCDKGKETIESGEFKAFIRENAEWLLPYAAYCQLSRLNSTDNFDEWGLLAVYDEKEARKYLHDNKHETYFIFYVQYMLHKQLEEACQYARSKGIFLMAQLADGLSPKGVEAWLHRRLFYSGWHAGELPKANLPFGKNKLSLACNWDAMAKDKYWWWRKRLSHTAKYCDAMRIDNVAQFFRTWLVPSTTTNGLLGQFSPAAPFTPKDIERYGLKFRKTFFTSPFINDQVLSKLFGMHTQYVKEHFLIAKPYGMYFLKGNCNTQDKIRDIFKGKADENSAWICDGLCRLTENVLFIEDAHMPNAYHPRVAAYREPVFKALNDDDREAFMRIYKDYYGTRHNRLGSANGMKNLASILDKTRMLVCADTVGEIHECVSPCLEALHALPVNIQAKPRVPGVEFAQLYANPSLSVAAISTPGIPPMRQWWEENPERTQRYYSTMLQKVGPAPRHLPANIAEEIIARHLYSPSLLCILSMQDWLSMAPELLNDRGGSIYAQPEGQADGQVPYAELEQIMEHKELTEKIKLLIKRSRR